MFLTSRRMNSALLSDILSLPHPHNEGFRALWYLPRGNENIHVVYTPHSAPARPPAAQHPHKRMEMLSCPVLVIIRALHSLPVLGVLESLGMAISPPTVGSIGEDGLGIRRLEFQAQFCCSPECDLSVLDIGKPAHFEVLRGPTVS